MTPTDRALLLVIEAQRARWIAENPAASWPGTAANDALKRLDEAAALLEP